MNVKREVSQYIERGESELEKDMTKPDQAAPTLSQEEIYHALLDLGWRIEACGASVELTNAVLLCSDIRQALGNQWNPADVYAARRVLGRAEISQTKAAPQAIDSSARETGRVTPDGPVGAAPLSQMPVYDHAEMVKHLREEAFDCRLCDQAADVLDLLRAACEQLQERYGYALDDGLRKSKLYNELLERAADLQRDLDAANEKAHGYYCDLSTERDMSSRLTIIASDAQRERDLAIEGSRKQMIRAEALQDKLDQAERKHDLMAATLKEIVENNDITVHEKHAEAIRLSKESGNG